MNKNNLFLTGFAEETLTLLLKPVIDKFCVMGLLMSSTLRLFPVVELLFKF
jgi:hypothetical protein